jgi:hypothetical protein
MLNLMISFYYDATLVIIKSNQVIKQTGFVMILCSGLEFEIYMFTPACVCQLHYPDRRRRVVLKWIFEKESDYYQTATSIISSVNFQISGLA